MRPLRIGTWNVEHARVPAKNARRAARLLAEDADYYGTRRGRALLGEALATAGLVCATATEHVPSGLLRYPPIDHVLVPAAWRTRVAAAWEGTGADAVRLSDHSGLVVERLTPTGAPADRPS